MNEAVPQEVTRHILETTLDGIATYGFDGTISFANQRLADLLGYSLAELMTCRAGDLVAPGGEDGLRERLADRCRGASSTSEVALLRKDGSILWVLVRASPLRDETGAAVGGFCAVTDLTDRRRVEELEQELADSQNAIRAMASGQIDAVAHGEGSSPVLLREAQDALRRSERLMRGIFDGALDAILLADDEGRYVDANPAACELFGLPRQQMLERRVSDFSVTAADVPRAWSGFLDEKRQRGHFDLLRADGTRRILEYCATANVLPGLHLSVLRDVTERVEAEKRFEGLLESAPDAMVIVDSTGHIRLVNRRTELLSGYAREELLGQPVEILIPDRFGAAHVRCREAYTANPTTRGMGAGNELTARRKDGSEVPVEICLSPSAEGTVTAALRDVSERRRADEALRRSEERYRRIIETTSEGVCIIGEGLANRIALGGARGITRDLLEADRRAPSSRGRAVELHRAGDKVWRPNADVSDSTSEDSGSKGASYAMRSASLTTSTVRAPNYGLGLNDFGLLTDSDHVVDSVNGSAVLVDAEEDPVTGEDYAIVSGALDASDPADDIALAFDEAQTSGLISGAGTELAASSFALDGVDLDSSPERTIIIRHTVDNVSAYQLLVITFHP